MSFFTGNIIQAICWTLLHSLWQGLLLAVITGVVMVLSKKSGSVLRYRLLSVIFIAFIVTVGITFSMQLHTAAPTHTLAAPLTPIKDVLPQIVKQDNIVFIPEQNGTANNMQVYINRFVAYFNEHASLIVTIWFIIFMARCVKILSGLVYIQRIRHYKTTEAPEFWKERITSLANSLQIKRHILLLQSAIIKVPVVVGFLKPTILIPIGLLNNLSQQEVESILIHELAHVRRKDYFFNLLQCFIDILFFFNPAVLWISSLIRNERENCCDDIAINETKSKKQFVQALVSFHQYNSNNAPAKYAMSFAARQNKLVNRVKRIVNNNNHTLNPVEKIVLLVCMLVFSVTFITVTNGQSTTPKKRKAQTTSDSTTTASKAAGVNVKTSVHTDVKTTVKATPDVTSTTDVKTDDNDNENPTSAEGYIDGLQAQGYKNLTVDQFVYLKRHGVDGAFIKSFADAGYGKLTLEQAVELKNHGVSVDYIKGFKEAGFANITLDEAISARNHGISPDYIKGFTDAGYKNITLEEAESLRNHGVSPDYIKSFTDAGYKNITLEEAESLRNHGVNVEYINELKQAGVKDLTLEKAEEYRSQGVNGDYLKSFKEAGFTDVTMEQAMNLREHGVSVDYIKELKEAGVKDITLEKAVEYRDHGINGNYIKSFHEAGFNVSVDKAIELRDHGVSVEYIRGIHNAGYPDVTPEQAIRLRDHGISPEYIANIRSLGIKDLTLDKAVELKDHGISAEYVNSFAKIGIKDLTIEKAIQLRDRGVTADFIERIRKKTGNDFTLDEYMKLKEVF